MFNPATRALQLAFARRNEALKALLRELRGMKLCLQFAFERFYLYKFLPQCRSVALRILRKAHRYFV